MKTLTLVVLLLLNFGTWANGQTGEANLDSAFSQLKGNGAVPFAKAIYPGEAESARQLVSQLAPLLQSSGGFFNAELVSRRFLTKRTERLIMVMYFENYPVYLRIDYYENSRGRIFLPAKLSKEAAEILPFDLISASGK